MNTFLQNRKILLELLLVFFFFLISRLPNLGHDNFNTDVWKWKSRTYDFSSGVFYLQPEKTLQKYHPGVTLMWTGTIAIKAYSGYHQFVLGSAPIDNDVSSIFLLDFFQKLFVTFVIGLTLVSIYYPLRKLFGVTYSAIFTFLLASEPFYIALSRVYHLEGLMTTFLVSSFVWFYYAYRFSYTKKHLFISSFFAALALLTKSSALAIVPAVGFVMFANAYIDDMYSSKQQAKLVLTKQLKTLFLWFLYLICVYVVLWPAMWVVPLNVLSDLYRGIFTIGVERGHEQIFFGKLYEDPGLLFYPVVFLLKSSPVLLFGLLVGTLFYKKELIGKENSRLVLFALVFALINLVEISVSSKKLDRYILPSMIFSLFLCASLIEHILSRATKNVMIGISVLFFTWYVYLFGFIGTDYFSYFNPLFGGLPTGQRILESKWIFGQNEIATYFSGLITQKKFEPFGKGDDIASLKDQHKKLVVAFPEKYYTQIWPFIREVGAWAVIEDLTPEAKLARFFVYPVWDDFSSSETRFKLKFYDTIKIRGVDSYNVYEAAL